MKETYLKHVAIVVLAICATLLATTNPGLADGAMVLLGTIAGYVFKNGVAAVKAPA